MSRSSETLSAAGRSPSITTYPSLYQPILVLGMPAFASFFVTVGMGLLLVLTRFHVLALVLSTTTPWLWAVLRRIGRDDPELLAIVPQGWFFRRFYQPIAQRSAPVPRIDRRALLP